VPFKTVCPNSKLPWINKDIKRDMKKRKWYYNSAKRCKSANDWNAYRRIKNFINCKIKTAHTITPGCSTTPLMATVDNFGNMLRAQRKDNHNISTLVVDGKPITESKCKANALNNSVFTKENLTNIPMMNDTNNPENTLPSMPKITISVAGIQQQLSLLDTNKASGPDIISSYILKNCVNEISPTLKVIFTQSLDTGVLPSDWLIAIVCPVFKKGNRTNVANYRPISLTSICSKTMEHIIYHSSMCARQNSFYPKTLRDWNNY